MNLTATNPILSKNSTFLKRKPHFKILDGLRGIAAIAVVIYHFMEFAVPDYNENFIAHSHLAVDFFFCLSGFVIAYAYDSKVAGMGAIQFVKLRLIRLHPLVIIGSVIGLLTFVFDPFSNLHEVYGAGKTFLMFISSCLLVPYPVVDERYFNIFHLNPPTWSLFWEYIANLSYVFILYKLRNKLLVLLLLIAALALCYESYHTGNLAVGWGGENFLGGGIRIFYSFLAGMLLCRLNWMIKHRFGFVVMGLLLGAVFFIPWSENFNWIIDLLIVLFYFPFLVALGAGAHLTPAYDRICSFLGDISYPLYMIHYPFLWIFLSYVEAKKPSMNEMAMIIVIGLVALVGLAYCTAIFLDAPLRKYLKGRLIKD